MNKDEAFIRSCARRGLSKSHTAQLLGFWPSVFPDYLKLLSLEDIEWCKPHQSLLAQQQRRDLHESRRGVPSGQNNRDRLRQYAAACHPKYAAFGVTGSLGELIKRFSTVTKTAIVYRMSKKGMTLEEALIGPRTDLRIGKKVTENHPWRQSERRSIAAYRERTGPLGSMEASPLPIH